MQKIIKPTLTIGIPTYNRGRYLSVLLSILSESLSNLKYSYELVISDNCSSDNTEQIVKSFLNILPIKYFRQNENIGGLNNIFFCMQHANSDFFVYLADDDMLDIQGLNNSISLLLLNPDAVALYAPWRIFDMVNNLDRGEFYSQPANIIIPKNDYSSLINHVFGYKIWPEISIVRTKIFESLKTTANNLAYWAFTIPCDYLNLGSVIFSSNPFYISITNYFPDENRTQVGHLETESAWDRYRGGWEYMLGRVISSLDPAEVQKFRNDIDTMVLDRMLVALRLRWHNNKDPVDTYYLACRLRGLGANGDNLPAPFDIIRYKAALWFAAHGFTQSLELKKINFVGNFEFEVINFICNDLGLNHIFSKDITEESENEVVVFSGLISDHIFDAEHAKSKGIKWITESDLMQQFS